MKKLKKNIIVAIVSAILAISVIAGATVAWLPGMEELNTDVYGSVLTKYFESGDGLSEETAFEIKTPRQLYNLAWIQYMGLFNKKNTSGVVTQQYYFKLSNSFRINGEDNVPELDMTGWTLPPIGTKKNPFVGHFDGNYKTISNLNVSGNLSSLTDPADILSNFRQSSFNIQNAGLDIVGLFGVVGSCEETAGTLNGITGAYDTTINKVEKVNIENIAVRSGTNTSLAGIVAGYVNGTIENVRVLSSGDDETMYTKLDTTDSSVLSSSITTNVSDFTTVGYCTDNYKSNFKVTSNDVREPSIETTKTTSTSSAGHGWGSSLDMQRIFNKLSSVKTNSTTKSEIWQMTNAVRYMNGDVHPGEGYTYKESNFYRSDLRTSDETASYTLALDGTTFLGDYVYLSGGAHVLDSTIIDGVDKDAFIVSDGNNHFMNMKFEELEGGVNASIVTGTSRDTATKWMFTGNKAGYMYTIYNQKPYYLDVVDNAIVVRTVSTGIATWKINTASSTTAAITGTIQATVNGVDANLDYYGGEWSLWSLFKIRCETKNKPLGVTAPASSGAMPTINDTSENVWSFEPVVANGTTYQLISVSIDGTSYYLTANYEVISLTNNKNAAVKWSLRGSNIYRIDPTDNVEFYLVHSEFDNKWKLEPAEYYYINDTDGHYLGLSDKTTPTLGDKTSTTVNTPWYKKSVTVSGTSYTQLYTILNNKKYSLYFDGYNISLSNTTYSPWTIGKTTVGTDNKSSIWYTDSGGLKYFLLWANGWNAYWTAKLKDNDGSIMGVSGSSGNYSITNTDSGWIMSRASSGGFYFTAKVAKNDYRNIYVSSNTLGLSSTNKTALKTDGSYFYYMNGSTKYILYCGSDNVWRLGQYYDNAYIIRATGNNWLKFAESSGAEASNATNRYDATQWQPTITYVGKGDDFEDDMEIYNTTLKIVGKSLYLNYESSGIYGKMQISSSSKKWVTYITDGGYKYVFYHYHKGVLGYKERRCIVRRSNAWKMYPYGSSYDDKYLKLEPRYLTCGLSQYVDPITEVNTSSPQSVKHAATTNAYATQLIIPLTWTSDVEVKEHQEFWDYKRDNVTYFPITANETTNVVSTINTGYVMAGSVNQISEAGSTYPSASGDIRVSRYAESNLGDDYVNRNWSWSKFRYERSVKKALTINKEGQDSVGSPRYPMSMFPKYYEEKADGTATGAKAGFDAVLDKANISELWRIYGLHFMDAAISKDNVIPLTKAVIDHTTYYDYQMPASSIAFKLQSRGFINFFSGTYYDGNNSFCSLHQIFRRSDQLAANSIMAIYTGSSGTVVKCKNGVFYNYPSMTSATITDSFDSDYTQKNSHVYMNPRKTGDALYYKDISSGKYFTLESMAAGTYFEILPTEYVDANAITDILEIEEIYARYITTGTTTSIDTNYEYIYKYKTADNKTYSVPYEDITRGVNQITYKGNQYPLAFNTGWITNPTAYMGSGNSFANDALYYFEIPTNGGEYALGSVSGKEGAYLMYLDIAASASTIKTQKITEVQDTDISTYEYPKGVQITDARGTTTIEDYTDSAGLVVQSGSAVSISRSGNAISYTSTATGANAVKGAFVGDGITLATSDGTAAQLLPKKNTSIITESLITKVVSDDSTTTPGTQNEIITTITKFNGTTTRTMENEVNGVRVAVDDDGHTVVLQDQFLLKSHSIDKNAVIPITTTVDVPALAIDVDYQYNIDSTTGSIDVSTMKAIAIYSSTDTERKTKVNIDSKYPKFILNNAVSGSTVTSEENLTLQWRASTDTTSGAIEFTGISQ